MATGFCIGRTSGDERTPSPVRQDWDGAAARPVSSLLCDAGVGPCPLWAGPPRQAGGNVLLCEQPGLGASALTPRVPRFPRRLRRSLLFSTVSCWKQ